MITGEQLRAARAMLRLDQGQLADEADISVETLKRFEAAEGEIKGRLDNIQTVERVLQAHGIVFIESRLDGDDDQKSGRGVKFAEDRTKLLRHMVANRVRGLALAILAQEQKKDPSFFEKGADHISDALTRDLPALIRHTLPSTMKFKNGIAEADFFANEDGEI
jgi:transcriptional regulator with XRE-family HTH domain